MQKTIKISLICVLAFTMLHANSMKKYEVKSGKIEYELKGSGNIMGIVKIKSMGKKRVIFDDYGVKNLEEKSEVKKETSMGKTKVKKQHTLTYMNQMVIYKADFKKKRIQRSINQGAAMANMFGGGDNLKESGEAMMQKMGGKKLGIDKVLGYTCEVWSLMGSKQCLYKGIPLKIETNVMGMKSTEVATKATFDIGLQADDFKLPDFPVYAFDMDSMMRGEEPKVVERSKLAEMDKKDNEKASLKAKESAEAMKGIAAGFEALAKTGFDMKSDKEMTPEQEQMMQKAMMKAMGGENKMLTRMKQDMLKHADRETMAFAKKCFTKAHSLKEANVCVDKGNQMSHDDQEHFRSWSKKDKKEILNDMTMFEKAIPCIKAAQSVQKLQRCLPR